MTISQGSEAQLSQPRDPSACISMPPLPPQHTLAQVEDAAMLEAMALIQPKRLVLDGDRQAGPIR
jgi:hypothetical protein